MARISRAEVRGYTLHGVGSGHFPYFFLKGGAVALKDSASRLGELATSPGTMRIESVKQRTLSRSIRRNERASPFSKFRGFGRTV